MVKKRGSISILVLVFGVVFTITIAGLVLVAAIQYTASTRTEAFERALSVAQAGAQYYQWHLAHNANDFTDGTNGSPPYVHQITDLYGDQATFSLTIDPPTSASSILTITSQGWLSSRPEIKRTIKVTYGVPSFTKYAFLQNANVWYGFRTTIHGKVFANGGIRMDGTHDSTVQSSKATYTCGTETGCDTPTTKPGIWGEGGPQSLWQFPVPAIDFNSINLDFSQMRSAAQSSGLYLGASGSYGYHLTFNSNGSFTVTKITRAQRKDGWSVENRCESLYENIQTEELVGTYQVSQKPIIFAEDNLWVEGVVKGRVTIVAARFPIDVNAMNIWIPNNITYESLASSNGLGLIAQNDIYFGLEVPTDFVIQAALLAQRGKVIRHNYKYQGCSNYPHAVKQSITIYGSLISNLKSYWTFGTGFGYENDPASGFKTTTITYNPNLYYVPPPYFPAQGQLEFISWEEE